MNKTITIVTRYQVKVNGDLVDTKDSIEDAVKEITDRNYDRIDDEIMSREDVRRDDTLEGYDQASYNMAWENIKSDIANAVDTSYAYDDENGHEWSIKSVREVKVEDIGMPMYYDIELEDGDWCYGEPVPTDCGDYVFLRKLNDDVAADASIRVYEAMSLKDGHRDVIACDNATNWAVGSDDDAELNKTHFETLASHGVRWSEIEDTDLYDWIEARREEAGL